MKSDNMQFTTIFQNKLQRALRYPSLYLHYVKLEIAGMMEYKLDFAVGIFAMFLANGVIPLILIWVIFTQVDSINGWTFPQLLLLNGLSTLVFGVWHTFASGGVRHIERGIQMGELDRVLIRPANTLIQMIAERFDEDGIGDVIGGFLKIGLASSMLSLVWSPYNILLILIFVAGGFLILFAIILAAACLAFWTTRVHSFLNIITNFSRFTEYPIEIYHPAIIFLLTFILPFAFVNYYPTQIFIGKGMHIEWAFYTPVVGIILFIIAYAIWKVGLKSYTSTGS